MAYFDSGPSTGYLREVLVDPGGLGLKTQYETDARGNRTAVIDPRGVSHTVTYNALDWPVEEVRAATGSTDGASPLSYRFETVYDRNGNVAEARIPFDDGGSSTRVLRTYGVLDELLTLEQELQPGGSTITTVYDRDANLNVTQVTEPVGNFQTIAYDARNLPVTRTVGLGTGAVAEPIVETRSYDAERQPTAVVDGRLNSWVTVYDGYGRVKERRDPLGNRTLSEYDENGNPTAGQSFGADGNVLAARSATYDALDRRTESTEDLWEYGAEGTTAPPPEAGAVTTRSTYDKASNVTAVTDPLGRTTSYRYDTAERLTGTTDPLGNRVQLELDAAGNATTTTSFELDPDGGEHPIVRTAIFDALSRPVSEADAFGNTTTRRFDARDLVRRVTDPEGSFSTVAYDGLNRKTRETQPEGIFVDYVWDGSSRLTTYRDALGRATTYTYDAANRRTSVTYPDTTTESYAYDAAHNLTLRTDANGSAIVQGFDAANRLTARTVTLAEGVLGPAAESYAYDGLYRLTRAQSGSVVTELAYDSLSRRLSDKTAERTVGYRFDDVGNVFETVYPSGHQVTRSFDDLDRPATIGTPAEPESGATYGYQGPFVVERKSLGPGLSGSMSFDVARRPVGDRYLGAAGRDVFREQVGWSRRGLKTRRIRHDLGGAGFAFEYDGAKRLKEALELPDKVQPYGNNARPDLSDVPALADAFRFGYDAAQNLASQQELRQGVDDVVRSLPADARNRPREMTDTEDTTLLAYDANGNLTTRGDLRIAYDFRNRPTRVEDPDGQLIAEYTYDAFNRRVKRVHQGEVEEVAWDGWQPIEDVIDGGLRTRRVYGLGLDEIARLETDLDEDGVLDNVYRPVYDSSGDLVLITAEDGTPIERCVYTPFGAVKILVDSTPPAVEQVRVVGGEIWLEASEEVLLEELQKAAGGETPTLTLTDLGSGDPVVFSLSQPVQYGRQARRRVVLVPEAAPVVDSQLELVVPEEALVDLFHNEPDSAFTVTIIWQEEDQVVYDTVGPRVDVVTVDRGVVAIELSETVDLATVSAVSVGSVVSWSLDAEGYRLVADGALPAGSYSLVVGTGLQDLSGKGLVAEFTAEVTVNPAGSKLVYQRPLPGEIGASAVGNRFSFHGHRKDPETGWLYLRNRYLDPELGRFVSADPLGYVDGPSMYQFARYNPVNFVDPLGLEVQGDPLYTLEIRSYAPFEDFGQSSPPFTGFKGDARGPTTATDVTSKMRLQLAVKPRSQTVAMTRIESSPSRLSKPDSVRGRLWGLIMRGKEKTEQPSALVLTRVGGEDVVGASAFTRAANPLVPFSPDIDLNVGVRLEITDDDELRVSGRMFGDGFPNAEVIVRDSSGASYLVHSFETKGGAAVGPFRLVNYLALFRGEYPGLVDMGHFEQRIPLTEEGGFECTDEDCTRPDH